MKTLRFQEKVLVNAYTGEVWSREGDLTDDIRDITIYSTDLSRILHPKTIHPDLIWGDINIEIRYYENRNEPEPDEKDSR